MPFWETIPTTNSEKHYCDDLAFALPIVDSLYVDTTKDPLTSLIWTLAEIGTIGQPSVLKEMFQLCVRRMRSRMPVGSARFIAAAMCVGIVTR